MTDKSTEQTLAQSAKGAILWSAGLNIFRDVLQFAQMLILVRLLDPAIYGMAGMASTIIGFIGLMSFQHIIPHVLQIRPGGEVNFHQHFSAGIVINGTLFVLTNIVAISLRLSEQYIHLQPLIHILSVTFLLSVPVHMRTTMLQRNHDWSRLRVLQMAGILISIISAVAMALAGMGVYALVVPGLLASTTFLVDLFLFAGWRPHWQWSYSSYRETLQFGLNRAGSNALNGGRVLIQNTLITNNYQFAGFGIFGRAEGLANMFCGRIAQEVSNALYPVITHVEEQTERFQRISGLVLQSIAWVVIPIAVFFSLEAEKIVRLLYGSKWLDVIPLLSPAMAIGVGVSIGATAYRLLLANEQKDLCLRSDIAAFVMAVIAMIILIPFGLYIYLVGAAVVTIIVATILITLLIHTEGIQSRGVATALIPPGLAAGFGAASLVGMNIVLANKLALVFHLLAAGLVFSLVYIFVLRIFFKAHLSEIMIYLPGGQRLGRLLYL